MFGLVLNNENIVVNSEFKIHNYLTCENILVFFTLYLSKFNIVRTILWKYLNLIR